MGFMSASAPSSRPTDIAAVRKRYAPPVLREYGSVKALTTGGGTEPNEGNMMMAASGPSQRELKENIVRVGTHPLGIGLYLFDYREEHRDAWGHGRQFGVMVDEVEKVMPEAVGLHESGVKMVDYARLGIRRTVH